MDLTFFLLSIAFLIFLSGFFSSSETALFSLPTTKIKAYFSDPHPRRKLIAQLLSHPRDLLVTIFMLNTLVNILIQNVFSSMVGLHANLLLRVILPLVITLIIGEIIPKYVGLQNNVAISYHVALTINLIQNLLKVVRRWIIAITTPISRIMFFFLKKEESISREELQHVLKTSEKHGVLQSEEGRIVWGYLNLQDSSVKELMSPREDITAYEIHEPLSKLLHLFGEKKQEQVVVYEKELDNVIGIISAKRYFLFRREMPLRRLLERPFYIPENTSARLLLRRLEEQNQTLAVVVDEYRSISGLISKHELLDNVFGFPSEEQDKNILYTRSGENEIIASGKLELSTFNEIFNVDLTSENNMVTIGGWLTEKLGDIPKNGTKFQSHGFLFQVLSAEPNRVRRIYIRNLNKGERK